MLAGVALGGGEFDPGGFDMHQEPSPARAHAVEAPAATSPADVTELDMNVRAVAARSIKPGCAQFELHSWNPKSSKPHIPHLRAEIKRRNAEVKCDNWDAQKCARWLHNNGPPTTGVATPANTATPVHEVAPGVADAFPDEADDAGKEQRWSARRHVPRLAHVINHHRSDFLTRDEKPKTRDQLDGAARNSFWQTAALTFADDAFKPALLVSRDPVTNEKFSACKLDPGPTTYRATAEKLETEFKSLRTLLVTALNNFRASGMGECATEDKVSTSNKVYSATFKDFVHDNVPVLYAYEVPPPFPTLHICTPQHAACSMHLLCGCANLICAGIY